MKNKTKNPKAARMNKKTPGDSGVIALNANAITLNDLKNSLLVVSLFINLFIFTTWLVLQVTTQYDAQMAVFLFDR